MHHVLALTISILNNNTSQKRGIFLPSAVQVLPVQVCLWRWQLLVTTVWKLQIQQQDVHARRTKKEAMPVLLEPMSRNCLHASDLLQQYNTSQNLWDPVCLSSRMCVLLLMLCYILRYTHNFSWLNYMILFPLE